MRESSPAGLRWTIRLLSVVLFFLFLWLFTFILGDIDGMQRPSRQAFYESEIDEELTRAKDEFNASLKAIQADAAHQSEIKQNRSEAMEVARKVFQCHKDAYEASLVRPDKSSLAAVNEAETRANQYAGLINECLVHIGKLEQKDLDQMKIGQVWYIKINVSDVIIILYRANVLSASKR